MNDRLPEIPVTAIQEETEALKANGIEFFVFPEASSQEAVIRTRDAFRASLVAVYGEAIAEGFDADSPCASCSIGSGQKQLGRDSDVAALLFPTPAGEGEVTPRKFRFQFYLPCKAVQYAACAFCPSYVY